MCTYSLFHPSPLLLRASPFSSSHTSTAGLYPQPEKTKKRFSKGNPFGCPHRSAAPSSTDTSSPQHFYHRCISLGYSWTLSATPSPKPESSRVFLCCSWPHGLFSLTSRALQSCPFLYPTPTPVAHWNFCVGLLLHLPSETTSVVWLPLFPAST